jgi:hypothetical protein
MELCREKGKQRRRSIDKCEQFYTDCCCQWVQTCFDRALSQGDRAFNSTFRPEPIMGVRNLAPKHVGRKETSCSYLNSSKGSHSRVSLNVESFLWWSEL